MSINRDRRWWLVLAAPLACAMGAGWDDGLPTAPSLGRRASIPRTLTVSGPASCAVGDTVTYTAVAKDTKGAVVNSPSLSWASSNSIAAPIVSVTPAHTTARVLCASAGQSTVTVSWAVGSPPPPVAKTLTVTAPTCSLVTDHAQHDEPTGVPVPAYLTPTTDPVYGTAITRITGDPGTALGATGAAWQQVNRHNYSKDAAWNADESRLMLKRVLGVGAVMLDGQTYQPLAVIPTPPGETRWHPTLPDVMVYISSACVAGHWNPETGATTVMHTGAGISNCDFGPYEGNASRDGNVVAMHGTRTADAHNVAYLVNLTTGQRWPDIDLTVAGFTSIDWASVSAGGAYLVVNGGFPGAVTCCGGAVDATKVFTRDGALAQTWTEYGRPSHYDLGVDVAGNEVAVGVSKAAPDEGKVIMRRLDTGAVTVLTQGGYAGWVSTRNTARLGWAYVTHTYNGPGWAPYRDEVFAVKLDGSLTIQRYANLHSLNLTDYEGQSHAVPSPSGTRVLFATDWESGTDRPVHAYVADTRPMCPSGLP